MTIEEILADIHACEQAIWHFERKYGIRSEIFYPAYMSGDEPEDDEWVADFGEWAAMYRIWLRQQAEYRNEIQNVQTDPTSIVGLVHVAA